MTSFLNLWAKPVFEQSKLQNINKIYAVDSANHQVNAFEWNIIVLYSFFSRQSLPRCRFLCCFFALSSFWNYKKSISFRHTNNLHRFSKCLKIRIKTFRRIFGTIECTQICLIIIVHLLYYGWSLGFHQMMRDRPKYTRWIKRFFSYHIRTRHNIPKIT